MTPRHWTEDELIAHLYGVGPEDGHLHECAECGTRLEQMQAARQNYESLQTEDEVTFDFLAAQRRRIYERLFKPGSKLVRRFAPALAASLVVAGGLLFYQQEQSQTQPVVKASDSQLVEDVGRVAMNPEPAPTAPLQALFEQ
jgi:hypothetical protein